MCRYGKLIVRIGSRARRRRRRGSSLVGRSRRVASRARGLARKEWIELVRLEELIPKYEVRRWQRSGTAAIVS